MWWLVATRPSGETKPPEPPLLKRTDARMARFSQASSRSNLYFVLSSSRGGRLSSHIPSSARAERREQVRSRAAIAAERNAGRLMAQPRTWGQGGCWLSDGIEGRKSSCEVPACGVALGRVLTRKRA